MIDNKSEGRIMTYLENFEGRVIGKFDIMSNDISELKEDVSGLKTDVTELKIDVTELKEGVSGLNSKFDRLDDRFDEQTDELKQEIRLQGAYLNQAFDRMTYMQSAVVK